MDTRVTTCDETDLKIEMSEICSEFVGILYIFPSPNQYTQIPPFNVHYSLFDASPTLLSHVSMVPSPKFAVNKVGELYT
jgi:hypothetical protein